MFTLDTWDIVLLAVAGFVAVTTLVRLMAARRDELLKKLRRDFEREQVRLKLEEKKKKRKQKDEAEKAA